jgi:RNA polymerase sigma-70 factor (ECF subfamily)
MTTPPPEAQHPRRAERALVEGLLRREEAAWGDFLDRYGPVIAKAGRRVLGSQATPEDLDALAGELCERLLAHDLRPLRAFRGESALATWVWCLARRTAVDRLRRKPRETRLGDVPQAEPAAPLEDPVGDAEAAERLREAIGQLPERTRTALRMAYWEERPQIEIAAALGLSAESIGPLLSRAKAELAKIMKTRTGADRPRPTKGGRP